MLCVVANQQLWIISGCAQQQGSRYINLLPAAILLCSCTANLPLPPPRRVDARLAAAGGERLRGLAAADVCGCGFADAFEAWQADLLAELLAIHNVRMWCTLYGCRAVNCCLCGLRWQLPLACMR
jgi:hypothetical protein